MNMFSYNNRYTTYERRICTKTDVFHPPPLEKDYLTISYNMPTMTEKRLIEENESLKTWFELSEAGREHYKRDRDCLRVEIAKFKDRSVKRDYEVSYPSVCTAKIHDKSFRQFEDISGNKYLIFSQNKSGNESLNLRNILLERLTHQEKTITTQKQELQKLRNENKKQDTRVNELENSVRDLNTENKNLQGVREESKRRERELTKIKDELQLASKKLIETKDELKKEPQYPKILQLEHDIKCREQEIKSLQKSLEIKTNEASDCKSLRSSLQETKSLLSALRNENKQNLQKLKHALTDVDVMKKRRSSDRLTNQNLEKQIQQLQKEIEQLHSSANHQTEVSKMSKLEDIERVEKDLKKRELQITSLNDQLQKTRRILAETESELRKTKTRHTDLQKQVQRLEYEMKQLHFKGNSQEAVSKTSQIEDSERLETEEELKNRDIQIAKLNDQLQQAIRKLTNTESELQETKTSYTKQVHSLEKEIEQLHLEANRQKAVSKMEESKRFEIEEELKKKKFKITSLNDQLQQARRKLTETESELREMKTRRTDPNLQKQAHHHEKEIEQLHLKANRSEAVSKTSETEDSERFEMEEELKKREVQITRLIDQLRQEKRKLTETESELQETKTRLSKAMGDKLTDNNPNIADLSDKNRPVKLAERFGELYDNQWTDAYDIIQKYFDTEERTLGELLNILQEIFCFCKTSWAKQMEDLLKALSFSANSEDVPVEITKILKDCKKSTASVAMRNLYEMYISRLQHSGDENSRIALEIRPFVKECLEICWLMMIQDPPVVFAPTAERGSKLDTDIFKPYTKSGTHVEYTVWPAMLLHEKGPVLAKGVAQGYKQE